MATNKSKTKAEKKPREEKKSPPERQALIMWALLATEKAGAFQKDLKPKPTPDDRKALESAGLVKCGSSRPIWIEVTDKGWAWANENLGHILPKQSTAGAEILRAWLVKLDAFLNARGLALAEVLGPQSVIDPKPPSRSLRDRIRAAYLDATGNCFNTRALLKDIRASLADVKRATLDEALTQMQREDVAVLYPLDNPAEITDADRAAAISFAGEPRHILWIDR
jgi:hypothetical protein